MAIGKVGKLLAAGAALFFLLVTAGIPSRAREVKDSVKIHFSQGYSVLDPSLGGNREALARIADSLRLGYADSVYTLKKVLVVGGASPEGGIEANRRLSEKRARVLFDWLSQYGELPDSLTSFEYLGRDWSGLIELVEQDAKVPYREETLDFLREIERLSAGGEKAADNNVGRLSRFKGGEPYRYMYRELFPQIRASQVYLWYEKDRNPVYLPGVEAPVASLAMPPRAAIVRAPQKPELPGRPFYMALKTNLLYDALLVPNVAVEFYLGSNWSLTGGWMYGWWKSDPAHWYWRTYGGELGVRRWFGRKAQEKPLTGHHLGVYGQLFTYDFELGGKGYMGGTPGESMWDSPNWALGVEYGYSLPIAKRLNLDFTVGVGYWGGIYYEYTPQDGHYVWEATRNRRWFGPTKAEISLVWLLGRGNTNGK